MSTVYTGNAATAPVSITIPSDGDGPFIKASDVNAAFEGLADQIAKAGQGISPVLVDFTANGTFLLPANALTIILADGWGSGSGGGGGEGGGSGTETSFGGGGGGAASLPATVLLIGVPGTSYTVTIGAAPSGGASNGFNGSSGNNTTLGALHIWPGAANAGKAGFRTVSTLQKAVARGGTPAGTPHSSKIIVDTATIDFLEVGLAQGGYGKTAGFGDSNVATGGRNRGGFSGGARGVNGTIHSSTAEVGGGGGGGAAGPGGAGGAGGNGGDSYDTIGGGGDPTLIRGANGVAAAANSGAGGGGGGGGGQTDDAGDAGGGVGVGGSGGAGGSGRLRVIYFIPTGG